jgi:hypothetical protein
LVNRDDGILMRRHGGKLNVYWLLKSIWKGAHQISNYVTFESGKSIETIKWPLATKGSGQIERWICSSGAIFRTVKLSKYYFNKGCKILHTCQKP